LKSTVPLHFSLKFNFHESIYLTYFNKVTLKYPCIGKCDKLDEILHQTHKFWNVLTKLIVFWQFYHFPVAMEMPAWKWKC